ncbi:MAG: RNA polymerase subunit sigma-70 [Ignavibacteriales bacterium CG07_land_8_20_14_0_80_59_12]|nr:MAG: RNA polymerase subunit sigma-70 [Ignavibacteriales bacterium CG07_land_8_20_14_0_80_59_12]
MATDTRTLLKQTASNKRNPGGPSGVAAVTEPTVQAVEDRELIENAKRADRAAFTKLVKQYEQLVFRFAFKLCRDERAAEEVMQDTFINVYRALPSFSGKSKFTTWLYRIAANNCLMRRRERARQHAVSLDDEQFPAEVLEAHISHWEDTPPGEAMTRELREALNLAISKLPMEYRTVFVLRDVEGVPAREVSKIMKLTVPAMKSRLRRARLFLREELNEYFTTK